MILELKIENYALIDQLTLEFSSGLNVLTGETGSGKSIILGALSLVLGGKFSSEAIRVGACEAFVELTLAIDDYRDLHDYLEQRGLECSDNLLILSRRMHKNGKSICRVNGRSMPLSVMRDLASYLIDIYGQHEYVSLFKPEKQLDLLDRYGGSELLACQNSFSLLYDDYKKLEKKYQFLQEKEAEKIYREELCSFQVAELEKAELKEGEDDELAKEEKVLANGEKIKNLLQQAYNCLYLGDQQGRSVLDGLYQLISCLQELGKFQEEYRQTAEKIIPLRYDLEELARDVSFRQQEMETDSYRLQEVQNRLVYLHNLKKKYQKELPALISYLSEIKEELNFFHDCQAELEKIKVELDKLHLALGEKGKELSFLRQKAAKSLEERIIEELSDLGMKNIHFEVAFVEQKIALSGLDKVEFLFSSNKGEKTRSLSAIASGGELSRVMLALKVILANIDQIPTLIFDEIDAGIGGRTAQVVGEKLAVVSRERQIICVTHSPQIASMADAHYSIQKEFSAQRTRIEVNTLKKTEQVTELARMLSGAELTELTFQHAQEMLLMAQSFKKEFP